MHHWCLGLAVISGHVKKSLFKKSAVNIWSSLQPIFVFSLHGNGIAEKGSQTKIMTLKDHQLHLSQSLLLICCGFHLLPRREAFGVYIYIDTLKFCGVSKNPQGSWGIDMETTPGAIHHRKKQIIRSVFYETHADSHEALTCTFNILTVWKWKRMAFFDSFSTTNMFSHISPKNSKGVGELMSFQHLGTRSRSIEGNRKLRKPLFHFDALVALCIFFSSLPL